MKHGCIGVFQRYVLVFGGTGLSTQLSSVPASGSWSAAASVAADLVSLSDIRLLDTRPVLNSVSSASKWVWMTPRTLLTGQTQIPSGPISISVFGAVAFAWSASSLTAGSLISIDLSDLARMHQNDYDFASSGVVYIPSINLQVVSPLFNGGSVLSLPPLGLFAAAGSSLLLWHSNATEITIYRADISSITTSGPGSSSVLTPPTVSLPTSISLMKQTFGANPSYIVPMLRAVSSLSPQLALDMWGSQLTLVLSSPASSLISDASIYWPSTPVLDLSTMSWRVSLPSGTGLDRAFFDPLFFCLHHDFSFDVVMFAGYEQSAFASLNSVLVGCGGGIGRANELYSELPAASWGLNTSASLSASTSLLSENILPVMVMLGGHAANRVTSDRIIALPSRSNRWSASLSWSAIPSASIATPIPRFGHAAGL
jgi:hypothetical protein